MKKHVCAHSACLGRTESHLYLALLDVIAAWWSENIRNGTHKKDGFYAILFCFFIAAVCIASLRQNAHFSQQLLADAFWAVIQEKFDF